jgi:pyruvate,orthophosphate dikinase
MTKWVYLFGDGKAEGRAAMRDLLGGKGAGLAEMSNLGLPVPPGLTITTAACAHYVQHQKLPDGLEKQVEEGLRQIERSVGATFGDRANPLLVSVRSGARVSMPGMMDTVLNLGLNDETVAGMAERTGDARFAYDSYRRFVQMYGYVVMGVEHQNFEELLELH